MLPKFLLIFAIVGTMFVPSTAQGAGICATIQYLKDGKVVSQSGSITIPANDKSKHQLKIAIKTTAHKICKDTHVRIGFIYINEKDQKAPVEYVLQPTEIPAGGMTKTYTLATNQLQGIYRYAVETYQISGTDVSQPSGAVNLEGIAVKVGDIGGADTGGGGTIPPKTGPTGKDNSEIDSGIKVIPGESFDTVLGTFFNPLDDGLTVPGLIVRIINILLMVVGIVSVVFIIVGGLLMVTAGGNESRVASGKKTVTYAVAGLILSLLSFSIVAIIQGIIS